MLLGQGVFDLVKDLGASIWIGSTGKEQTVAYTVVKGNVWAFGIGVLGWLVLQFQKAGVASEGAKDLLQPITDIGFQAGHFSKIAHQHDLDQLSATAT